MDPVPNRGKTAIVAYRKNVYHISPTGLRAMMELTRAAVDPDHAIGFVLRQEGYDIDLREFAGET